MQASELMIPPQYDDAQAEAKEAAAVAVAQIGDLQVITHVLQLYCLPSLSLRLLARTRNSC